MTKQEFISKLNLLKTVSVKKGTIKKLDIQKAEHFNIINEQAQLEKELVGSYQDINNDLLAAINYLNELLKKKDAEIERLQSLIIGGQQ